MWRTDSRVVPVMAAPSGRICSPECGWDRKERLDEHSLDTCKAIILVAKLPPQISAARTVLALSRRAAQGAQSTQDTQLAPASLASASGKRARRGWA